MYTKTVWILALTMWQSAVATQNQPSFFGPYSKVYTPKPKFAQIVAWPSNSIGRSTIKINRNYFLKKFKKTAHLLAKVTTVAGLLSVPVLIFLLRAKNRKLATFRNQKTS